MIQNVSNYQIQGAKQTPNAVATGCKLAEASDNVGATDCKLAEASDNAVATNCKLTKASDSVGATDCKATNSSDNVGDVNCKLSLAGAGFSHPIRTLSKYVAIGKGALGHGRKIEIITLRTAEKALRTAENRISANLSVSSSVLSVTNTYFTDHNSSDNVGDVNCKLSLAGAGFSHPIRTLSKYVAIGKGTLGYGRKIEIITLRTAEKSLRTAENRISANLSVSSSVLSVTNTYFTDHKSSENVGDVNCKLSLAGAVFFRPYGATSQYTAFITGLRRRNDERNIYRYGQIRSVQRSGIQLINQLII